MSQSAPRLHYTIDAPRIPSGSFAPKFTVSLSISFVLKNSLNETTSLFVLHSVFVLFRLVNHLTVYPKEQKGKPKPWFQNTNLERALILKPRFPELYIDRIRKNMPTIDSKTASVARRDLNPLAKGWPSTHARDMDLSSRVSCQHMSKTEQTRILKFIYAELSEPGTLPLLLTAGSQQATSR